MYSVETTSHSFRLNITRDKVQFLMSKGEKNAMEPSKF